VDSYFVMARPAALVGSLRQKEVLPLKRATIIPKLALALALSAGALTLAVPSNADPGCKKNPNPICPQIYSPVICDNNKVYTNSCYAQADCATNCTAYGGV
jgi:hypothetical protein